MGSCCGPVQGKKAHMHGELCTCMGSCPGPVSAQESTHDGELCTCMGSGCGPVQHKKARMQGELCTRMGSCRRQGKRRIHAARAAHIDDGRGDGARGVDDLLDARHALRHAHARDARKVERLQRHLRPRLADALRAKRADRGACARDSMRRSPSQAPSHLRGGATTSLMCWRMQRQTAASEAQRQMHACSVRRCMLGPLRVHTPLALTSSRAVQMGHGVRGVRAARAAHRAPCACARSARRTCAQRRPARPPSRSARRPSPPEHVHRARCAAGPASAAPRASRPPARACMHAEPSLFWWVGIVLCGCMQD